MREGKENEVMELRKREGGGVGACGVNLLIALTADRERQ